MVDIGIVGELVLLELCHLPVGLGNRAVLRQVPVDDQFRTVGAWEELLLHQTHAGDGTPKTPMVNRMVTHASAWPSSAGARRSSQPALLVVVLLHRLGQHQHAEKRGEENRDDPGDQQRNRNDDKQRVKVNSPAALLLRPIGMKPATVTSVPVSIGKAVDV